MKRIVAAAFCAGLIGAAEVEAASVKSQERCKVSRERIALRQCAILHGAQPWGRRCGRMTWRHSLTPAITACAQKRLGRG
jgi:hypothetical protein